MRAARPRAAGLATALTAGLLLASGLQPVPAGAADSAPDQVEVVLGTYNIVAGVSPLTFGTALDLFAPRVDVAGLQEVNSKDKEAVLALMGLTGWSYYRDQGPGRGEQTPVLWRHDRFRLLSAESPQISEPVYVGPERPPGHIAAKYASVVRLLDSWSGRTLSVLNVHLIPGAVRGGRPVAERPRLARLFKRQMRAVAGLTRTELGRADEVFVLGDFNAGFVPDRRHRRKSLPFRTFKALGLRSNWATQHPTRIGTRDDALIDQIYHPGKAVRTQVVRDLRFSDHRPATATYVLDVVS